MYSPFQKMDNTALGHYFTQLPFYGKLLLKMLEGTVANVPPQGGRKHPEQQYLSINTKNILFILAHILLTQ